MEHRGKIVAVIGVIALLGIALYIGIAGGLFNMSEDLEVVPSSEPATPPPPRPLKPAVIYLDNAGKQIIETELQEPVTEEADLIGGAPVTCPQEVSFHYRGDNITVLRTVTANGLREADVRADLLSMMQNKVIICGNSLKPGFFLRCGQGCKIKRTSRVAVAKGVEVVSLLSAGPLNGKMRYVYEVSADCTRTVQCEAAAAEGM